MGEGGDQIIAEAIAAAAARSQARSAFVAAAALVVAG